MKEVEEVKEVKEVKEWKAEQGLDAGESSGLVSDSQRGEGGDWVVMGRFGGRGGVW